MTTPYMTRGIYRPRLTRASLLDTLAEGIVWISLLLGGVLLNVNSLAWFNNDNINIIFCFNELDVGCSMLQTAPQALLSWN